VRGSFMWGGNEVQKNFKKQMKELEKEAKGAEKEGSGLFTNRFFKERFYGVNYDENEARLSKAFKRSGKKALKILYAVLLIVALIGGSFKSLVSPILYDWGVKYSSEGNYEKALKIYDGMLILMRNDFELLYYKASTLNAMDRHEDAIAILRQAEKIHNNDVSLYGELGYAYYCLGKYEEALKEFNNGYAINSDSSYILSWMSYVNVMLENYDKASELSDKAIKIDDSLALPYEAKAEAYRRKGELKEALSYYNIAIEKEPKWQHLYVSKISLLYRMDNYMEGIDFALESYKRFPDESEIPYYLGDMYSDIGDTDSAVRYYEEALKLAPQDVNLTTRLGMEYVYLQNYDSARKLLAKASEIDTDASYDSVKMLRDTLAELDMPEAERIVKFFRTNYLYIDEVNNFEQKAASFTSKAQLTTKDIEDFVKAVTVKKDAFSYLFDYSGFGDYKNYGPNRHISSMMLDEKGLYVKITSFETGVDGEFKEIISDIKDTSDFNLILDLRDNPGGLISQASNILDLLLPETVICYTVDRESSKRERYSSASSFNFKKIIVMVNEMSASSSELLTLGLRENLDNVTVIGKPTSGKGVGQVSYVNRAKQYEIHLVNFYWYVKEKNVIKEKIKPDIYISGSNYSDYLEVVRELIRD
jgi:tetratricopeptide (TPR) repeat protein